jgi:hypothetical protein
MFVLNVNPRKEEKRAKSRRMMMRMRMSLLLFNDVHCCAKEELSMQPA